MLETEFQCMVNLVCQAHGLSLLIKDLLKHVGGVGSALEHPLTSATLRVLIVGFASCYRRSRRDLWEDLSDMLTENAVKLLEPILALLQSLEADKPLLSQCLPAWYSIYQHVKYWCEEELQSFEDIMPVLRKRFLKKCYHPAMAAAFLMDPVFWEKDPVVTCILLTSR
ncbi:TPA: hypothetical protein ACH3X1_007613 [Trebouxia sp. C0004]